MAKRGGKSTAQIQKLLDERRKIEQWLQRLEMAADETAGAVRDKVRVDYQERLSNVVTELQGFGDQIRATLDGHRSAHTDLKAQEKTASEELAEAELRHAVGEFGEEEWRSKKAGILEVLVKVREELADEEGEIGELEEVLALLEAPPPERAAAGPPPAGATPAAEATAEARLSIGSELGLRDLGGDEGDPLDKALDEVLAEVPAQPAPRQSMGDELAFLKSVTEDAQQGPRASGATGTQTAVPENVPPPARTSKDLGTEDVEKLEPTPVGKSRPSVINQRTLKCGECGAMNLPTEWYCDRCGAELAAL